MQRMGWTVGFGWMMVGFGSNLALSRLSFPGYPSHVDKGEGTHLQDYLYKKYQGEWFLTIQEI